jgi:hypothetical protein
MSAFDKYEGGGRQQFTLTASGAFDTAPSFAFFNSSGTLVNSITGTASSTTAYYAFADLPNTPGYNYFEWQYGQASQAQILKGVFEIVTTTVLETAGLYCSANDVRNLYKPLSQSDLRNNEIDEFIQDIMNEVDARLGLMYSTPINVNTFAIVKTITKNLTLAMILEQRGGAEIPQWITERSERYRDMLTALSDGTIALESAVSQADHSMANYVPTFNMLSWQYQRVDPDRLDDEEDAL